MADLKPEVDNAISGQNERKEPECSAADVTNQEISTSAVQVAINKTETNKDLLPTARESDTEAVTSDTIAVTSDTSDTKAVTSDTMAVTSSTMAVTSDTAAENCDSNEQSAAGMDDIDLQNGIEPVAVVDQPGVFPVPTMFWPPGLEDLIEMGQLVTHKSNLRKNEVIKESSIARMEMIDETRRVRFFVEQEPNTSSSKSFTYSLYNRHKQEVIQVISTGSRTCVCCKASWHCMPQCHFQTMVFAPPGQLVGFVRRAHSWFVQEFDILDANEDVVLVLRGGMYDLEIYSPDFEHELGRLAVHGWHGIMHEVKRSGEDIGITFPMDLAIHMKAVLIGAVFAIDWLYSTQGGRRR